MDKSETEIFNTVDNKADMLESQPECPLARRALGISAASWERSSRSSLSQMHR
jgi:hypothetical protein